jgi:hypothetical protein
VRTLILLILAGAFTFVAGWMDIAFVTTLLTEARAAGFAQTEGVITQSAAQAWPDRPDTFDVTIAYAYDVAGERYRGAGLRGPVSIGAMDSDGADALTRAWPQGAHVSVYYDPRQPAFSLLQRGVQGRDLLALLYTLLFNLAAALLLSFLMAETVGFPAGKTPENGFRTFSENGRTHARLEHFRPVFTFFGMLALTCFAALLIAGSQLSAAGDIGVGAMLAIWTGIVLLTGFATLHQYRKQESGLADLIIDAKQGVIDMPRFESPSKRLTVPFADITDVRMETVERRGMRGSRTWTDQVSLSHRDGRSLLVAELGDTHRAKVFANWLRRQIDAARRAAPT